MTTTTSSAVKWDAVVIGAGHNALVTAAYLGKAGLNTLVLERRDRVGGAADTTELAKGVRVPTLAHTVGRLRPSIQKDIDLGAFGLKLVAPDVRVFAPQGDGSAITLWADPKRTAGGLRARGASDGAAYEAFDAKVRAIGRFLDELGRQTPPDIKSPGLADAVGALKLGRSFKGLGRDGSRTVLRILPMAIADLVAEAFDDDLRDLESGKIKCGAAHFRALAMGENPVIYGKFRDVDGLLNSERTLSP